MLKQGSKQKEIGLAIGKDKSVISRELKRNKDQRSGEYRSDLAKRKTANRHELKAKQIKFTAKIKKIVDEKLGLQWSPEQISNAVHEENVEMVSHERIYQYIIEDKKQGGELYQNLRRKKKYRKRIGSKDNRGKIKNSVSIKERPEIVDKRERIGDFEVDLVVGANHKGALLTINERKSGYAKIRKLKTKNAEQVAKAIVRALKPIAHLCKTITSDNGKEFARHEYVSSELGVEFYFADPYASWQRGANENYNGLIRQYFPKKSSFENITTKEIKRVEKLLNNRPRKRFGYISPLQKINSLTKVAFVA
ncbi:UNVERIFIED_CONTAM: hypothetical protein GTU68_053340 [Idotea baltica]|nr:hypothetical protein [Idotea baltica]